MYRTRRRTTEKLINIVVPCVSMRMLMRLDHKLRLVGTVGRYPLCPQKQTLYRSHGMSLKCHYRTLLPVSALKSEIAKMRRSLRAGKVMSGIFASGQKITSLKVQERLVFAVRSSGVTMSITAPKGVAERVERASVFAPSSAAKIAVARRSATEREG